MLWQIGSLVHVAITLSCQINVPWYLVYCSNTGYSLCLTGVCHESVRENRNTVAITLWSHLYIVTPNLVIHKNTFVNSDRLCEHFIVPIPKWANDPSYLGGERIKWCCLWPKCMHFILKQLCNFPERLHTTWFDILWL